MTSQKHRDAVIASNKRRAVHGMSNSSEYRIWKGMHRRCTDPKFSQFDDYGGRGIFVCDRWSEFITFYNDMGPRPSSIHQLDRIDNDKGYNPSNCKWVLPKENARNRRNNKMLTAWGETKAVSDWIDDDRTLVEASLVWSRIRYCSHWSGEDILTKEKVKGRAK